MKRKIKNQSTSNVKLQELLDELDIPVYMRDFQVQVKPFYIQQEKRTLSFFFLRIIIALIYRMPFTK